MEDAAVMDLAQFSSRGERIEVRPARALRDHVNADVVFFEYPGYDVSALPREVAVLPFLWTIASVVWATGARFELETLPESVVESMAFIRGLLRRMYPSLAWDGEISARNQVADPPMSTPRFAEAVMYSGGVDSIYSALRHRGPQTLLVSVWGADIALRDGKRWARHEADARGFAGQHAGGLAIVRSNFRDLNYVRVNDLTDEVRRWWIDVQFSMALTGVAAPLLHLNGIPTLHLAGGLPRDETTLYRHASSPLLDHRIALAGPHVHHDGAQVNRHPKVDLIVQMTDGAPVRVCHVGHGADMNCGRCRKCIRTQAAIYIAKGDPCPYGFPHYSIDLLRRFGRAVASGEVTFAPNEIPMWTEIQAIARERGSQGLGWLLETDFADYQRQHSVPAPRSRRLLGKVIARAPHIQHRLKSLVRLRKASRLLP
ncbi:MAG: hypothetical protein ABI797_04540 [Chloroflexota bacterium]